MWITLMTRAYNSLMPRSADYCEAIMRNDLRHWMTLCEATNMAPTLYHGTCEDDAQALLRNGWQPNTRPRGGNLGQTRYLYLSTGLEDALWFAQQKGCDTVLAVINAPLDHLQVDPEDGTGDTLEQELSLSHDLPGKVVLIRSLGPEHFTRAQKSLDEAAVVGTITDMHSSNEATVFNITSRRQLDRIIQQSTYKDVRGILTDDALHVWDAETAAHASYERSFGHDGSRIMLQLQGHYNISYYSREETPDSIKSNLIFRRLFTSHMLRDMTFETLDDFETPSASERLL
jgi:hypothetical protein